jgi:hypothetical protein
MSTIIYNCVVDPDPYGCALIWFSWILIWISIGNADANPGARKIAVFRIRIHRIHVFFGLPDPDQDPSIIMQK